MEDVQPRPRAYDILPGCGLAAYAMLLLFVFCVGVAGLTLWTLSIMKAGDNVGFSQLTYGGNVSPDVLVPLHKAGLLKEGEIPDVYHMETPDAQVVCAVANGDFIRLSPTEKLRFPLSEIREIQGDEEEVIVVAGQTVRCFFYPDTGGDRFRRILGAKR